MAQAKLQAVKDGIGKFAAKLNVKVRQQYVAA
jgi:hypothetical protein